MLNRLFRFSPEQLQRWEPTRARGKWHFIFSYGIVRFASICFLFLLCILLDRGYSFSPWFISLLMLISLATGVLWAWWMWYLTSPSYSYYEPSDKS